MPTHSREVTAVDEPCRGWSLGEICENVSSLGTAHPIQHCCQIANLGQRFPGTFFVFVIHDHLSVLSQTAAAWPLNHFIQILTGHIVVFTKRDGVGCRGLVLRSGKSPSQQKRLIIPTLLVVWNGRMKLKDELDHDGWPKAESIETYHSVFLARVWTRRGFLMASLKEKLIGNNGQQKHWDSV